MLIDEGSQLFMYAVTRDLGFAPNPFHGVCTLATCKPAIRSVAKKGDWIVGVAGAVMKKDKGKCIYIMKVTEKLSFQDYWDDDRFGLKKPVRNGSLVQTLGDNIYHVVDGEWVQEDSHHSNSDGSANIDNLNRDINRTDQVLVSDFFVYFGRSAIDLPLDKVGYRKVRGHKKIDLNSSSVSRNMIKKIFSNERSQLGLVVDDPFDFEKSRMRVDQSTGKYKV